MGNLRLTQDTIEVLVAPAAKQLRLTQDSLEVLRVTQDLIATLRLTQDTEEVGVGGLVRNLRLTQATMEVLVTAEPSSEGNFNNNLLVYTLTHKGPSPWSTFSAFPIGPDGVTPTRIITIKEVQLVRNDETDTTIGVLFSADDGNIYQMWAGEQDGTVVAVAQTWPLPDLTQVPVEFRDSIKIFRELWVEGVDLPNWTISYSVNMGFSFTPPTRLLNRNKIGLNGRQIILRFTHAKATDKTPLLSYMKLNWDIEGQAQGGNY